MTLWKHYEVPEEDEDAEVCRPCGRFSLYAGDLLLGWSQLERELNLPHLLLRPLPLGSLLPSSFTLIRRS